MNSLNSLNVINMVILMFLMNIMMKSKNYMVVFILLEVIFLYLIMYLNHMTFMLDQNYTFIWSFFMIIYSALETALGLSFLMIM